MKMALGQLYYWWRRANGSSRFGYLVDYFAEHDIHVGVTTNGTLIKKYMKPLANNTKWVRVSVDAAPEVFKNIGLI